jgi:photosystem II stability/assembly factor-like uncharacterized protein
MNARRTICFPLFAMLLATTLSVSWVYAQTGWTRIESGTTHDLHAVLTTSINYYPANDNTLVAAGDSGTILYSTNSGNRWSVVAPVTDVNLHALGFAYPDTGFAVGDSGVIVKMTTPGGIPAWSPIPSGITTDLYAILFPTVGNPLVGTTSNGGFVGGANGDIYLTSNRGVTWSPEHYHPPTSASIRSLSWINTLVTDWACGDSGVVLKTVNIGNTWQFVTIPPLTVHQNFYGINFCALDTGYVVGENGTILFTSNGSYSNSFFLSETSGVTVTLRAVQSFSGGIAFAVGDSGTFLKTNDYGMHWRKLPTGTTQNLYGVSFADTSNGVIVGTYGTILTTSTGGENGPLFETDQSFVDFGSVSVGTQKLANFQITNRGVSPLIISGMQSTLPVFSIAQAIDTIYSNQSASVQIVFSPVTAEFYYGTILIYDNTSASPNTFPVEGTGVVPHPANAWTWQQPSPQGNYLFGTEVISQNTAFASGASGTIMKTTDGGASWSTQSNVAGTTSSLEAISFPTSSSGWVVGSEGTILHTSDGGSTWTQQSSGTTLTLTSVSFADPLHGVCVGGVDIVLDWFITSVGIILSTSDGGNNWTVRIQGNCGAFSNVHLINSSKGFAVNQSDRIWRTFDGGITWDTLTTPFPTYLYAMSFPDSLNGFISGGSFVAHTSDGGQTWGQLAEPPQGNILYLSFWDASHGIATVDSSMTSPTYFGIVLSTSDGGGSWSEQMVIPEAAPNQVSTWGTSSALLVGDIGFYYNQLSYPYIYSTSDEGNHWLLRQHSLTYANLYGISYGNSMNATAVGDSGTILHTTDGGTTWSSVLSGTLLQTLGYSFTGVSATDAQHAFAVGAEGTFVSTSDDWSHWSSQSLADGTNLTAVSFADSNNGITVGINGTIVHTSTGGAEWNDESDVSYGNLNAVLMVDARNSFIAGAGGLILHTTNAGVLWIIQPSGTSVNLNSISFTDSYHGTVVGDSGTVLQTTDAGGHWTRLQQQTYFSLHGVAFPDAMTGYAVGDGPTVLVTTDGGGTWNSEVVNVPTSVHGVACLSSGVATIVGANGTILHTTNAGGILGVKEPKGSTTLPKKFALYQNYPDPFNPVTTIRYDLPAQARVSLKLYDILGREVATLVDENQNAGSWIVRWDASNYASGVYFYRITAGTFTGVKKLLLIK